MTSHKFEVLVLYGKIGSGKTTMANKMISSSFGVTIKSDSFVPGVYSIGGLTVYHGDLFYKNTILLLIKENSKLIKSKKAIGVIEASTKREIDMINQSIGNMFRIEKVTL